MDDDIFQWENHSKSLKLEEETLAKIRERIQEKVMAGTGTWIDWQYLLDAAALLARCRYTLQNTYPFAYYLESGPRKDLVSQEMFIYISYFYYIYCHVQIVGMYLPTTFFI